MKVLERNSPRSLVIVCYFWGGCWISYPLIDSLGKFDMLFLCRGDANLS